MVLAYDEFSCVFEDISHFHAALSRTAAII